MGKTKVSSNDTVYCFGMIGAIIYYVGAAEGFWAGCLGFLKGLVWPGFLVYETLRFLQP